MSKDAKNTADKVSKDAKNAAHKVSDAVSKEAEELEAQAKEAGKACVRDRPSDAYRQHLQECARGP